MPKSKEKPPNPGSKKAVDAGCRCPAYDNADGRGYCNVPGRFVVYAKCPLHGKVAWKIVEGKRDV